MIYNSVADILAANDEVRSRVVERAENLSAAQQSFRPGTSAWSPAEIVEHLSIIERNLVRVIGLMVKKTESEMAETGVPPRPMQPFSLDEFAAQARGQKFVAPEEVRPRGASVNDSLAQLRESRATLNALRPRLEAVDGTSATYPHPVFGPLNLYQWVAFIGVHEARHLRQLERVLASMNGASAPETQAADVA
jgi:hypothetical protein